MLKVSDVCITMEDVMSCVFKFSLFSKRELTSQVASCKLSKTNKNEINTRLSQLTVKLIRRETTLVSKLIFLCIITLLFFSFNHGYHILRAAWFFIYGLYLSSLLRGRGLFLELQVVIGMRMTVLLILEVWTLWSLDLSQGQYLHTGWVPEIDSSL